MAVLHSLLWAALPFLSLISPSLQAVGTLRVDDEHRGTISAVTVTGPATGTTTGTAIGAGTATPTPIPLLGTQSEPVAVEGAYLIAFKEDYRYDDKFLAKLSDKLNIQATLRLDLTGEAFNGISIQIRPGDDADDVVDTPTKIAASFEEVVAVSPHARAHPARDPREFRRVDDPAAFLVSRDQDRAAGGQRFNNKRQHLEENGTQSTHVMAQVDEAYKAGWTGKGQKIAIIDAWIDYTHPALGGCLGPGCLVTFHRSWLEPDDVDNPDPECKSHATALAGLIAAQEHVSGIRGVAPGVQLGSYAISGCKHGGNDEKLLQALDQGIKDGVTAVVYSMGNIDGWSNEALDIAFDRASRRGLLVAVSAGNHGEDGIFKTSRPAEAAEVLGVGSVDNTRSFILGSVSTYTTSSQGGSSGEGEFAWRDGEPGSGAAGWKGVTMPLWSKLNKDDLGGHCENLFPADVPDLSKYIVLVPRPRDGRYCSDIDLAARAGDKGAVYVLMIDADQTQRIEVPRVNTPSYAPSP
ncbi:peptidase S8/S53 domain-containing protein [Apiospora saccharicola]